MKGLIFVNAYYDAPEYLYQADRLKHEFALLGVDVDILSNKRFQLYIKNDAARPDFSGYDFCVFWDKDKYAMTLLEKIGIPVFNTPGSIQVCDDKMLTVLHLANEGIPVPDTLPGLLCFDQTAKVSPASLDAIENALGYPLVAKRSFGSQGKGVYLIKSRAELDLIAEELKTVPHLFQKYISTSHGKDLRVIVVGGKVLGAMLRRSENDFRSNIGSGGKGKKCDPSPEIVDLATKIAKILKLNYCGIDLLFDEHGMTVCEVNSNAFFSTFESVTGLNVAKAYAEHIMSILNT